MNERQRKHWGWGFEDQQPGADAIRASSAAVSARLGLQVREVEQPLPLEAVVLRAPRVPVPRALAAFADDGLRARATHALGKSYIDVVLGMRGRFDHPPDFVVRPRTEGELELALQWCAAEAVAVIPYGGGTSVVGGASGEVGSRYSGAISLDTAAFAGVHEVDPVSRSALIGAGTLGPALEDGLRRHGLTLRHFPQSFEYSTLGGWIATRAGGHFATRWTHIEDLVESLRAITPAGAWESRRLPASGAGISPDRMLVGSEGALGVITRAWMRVQPRPRHRASAAVAFDGFIAGAEAVRAIAQSGLDPANCRLLDAGEAGLTMAGDGEHAMLILGFESADHDVQAHLRRALEMCTEHGGRPSGRTQGSAGSGGRDGGDAVGSWREAFLGAPYVRDTLIALGVLAETFETAITWERLPAFHEAVTAAVTEAMRQLGCRGTLFCRFTHVYPDGAAPYFTVLAEATRGGEVEQWQAIKDAASSAIIDGGGTITHHHAVGRDHRPWYDRQRPDAFAAALSGAKAAIDPAAIMNPGVLVGSPS